MEIFCEITLENQNSSEICLENWNLLWNYMKKIEIFRKFALKNRFFACEIAWKNLIFKGIFLQNGIFWPGSTTSQISNQIDAADWRISPRISAKFF